MKLQRNFKCRICDKLFGTHNYLLKHVTLRHVVTAAEIKLRMKAAEESTWTKKTKRPCDFCGVIFATKGAFQKHLRKHGKVQGTCHVCGMIFQKVWQHRLHMKRHEVNVPCGKCDRMFVSHKLLRFHMKYHTGERKFLCEQCGAPFLTQHALQGHSRQVHIEAALTCKDCGRRFKREAVLKNHRCRVAYKGKRRSVGERGN